MYVSRKNRNKKEISRKLEIIKIKRTKIKKKLAENLKLPEMQPEIVYIYVLMKFTFEQYKLRLMPYRWASGISLNDSP